MVSLSLFERGKRRQKVAWEGNELVFSGNDSTLHGHIAYLLSIGESKDHDLWLKNTAHLFSTEISQEGKRTPLEHTANIS